MSQSTDGTCHGCPHHRQVPARPGRGLLDYDHSCAQTGAVLSWPLTTPASCPYHALPSGEMVRRLDQVDATLALWAGGGLLTREIPLAELQELAATMLETCDPSLIPRLHALQQRLGTWPAEERP